eukprot:TRINITY_DN48706_c0_g1_i1.p1 TRINITY_DN48706_c0_g1~~TRINITY_DN48706_c0_g1_i1.p1  ORF type:complete len:117 (+),score=6.66 TRINITY_DN48706_c0_g1_i1:396-746(+)
MYFSASCRTSCHMNSSDSANADTASCTTSVPFSSSLFLCALRVRRCRMNDPTSSCLSLSVLPSFTYKLYELLDTCKIVQPPSGAFLENQDVGITEQAPRSGRRAPGARCPRSLSLL